MEAVRSAGRRGHQELLGRLVDRAGQEEVVDLAIVNELPARPARRLRLCSRTARGQDCWLRSPTTTAPTCPFSGCCSNWAGPSTKPG